MDLTGAVDNWGGHQSKDLPLVPDFTKLGGKPPREVVKDEASSNRLRD